MSTKKKHKRALKALPPLKNSSIEIPAELKANFAALTGFAKTYELLVRGSFTHAALPHLDHSVQFIKGLHELALEECLAHKYAYLIPELANVLSERAAKAKAEAEKEAAHGKKQ